MQESCVSLSEEPPLPRELGAPLPLPAATAPGVLFAERPRTEGQCGGGRGGGKGLSTPPLPLCWGAGMARADPVAPRPFLLLVPVTRAPPSQSLPSPLPTRSLRPFWPFVARKRRTFKWRGEGGCWTRVGRAGPGQLSDSPLGFWGTAVLLTSQRLCPHHGLRPLSLLIQASCPRRSRPL